MNTMNNPNSVKAVAYVNTFRDSLAEIWGYVQNHPLDSIVYSKGGYGVMQHEELHEILVLLRNAKKRIDDLYDECQDISDDSE